MDTPTSTSLPQQSTPDIRHFFSRLLSVCLSVYGVALILYGLLRILTGESLDLIRILDNLMPPLILPSILFLLLSLLMRRWRIAALYLPSVIAFVLIYGSGFIPRAAAQGQPDLTLMTYNLKSANHDMASIAQVINASNADVVVMQEIWLMTPRLLTPLVSQNYPYSSIYPYKISNSRLGLGVFSRYPLTADNFDAYQAESSRLRIQIEVNDATVTIYDVHLVNPLLSAGDDPKAHAEGITELLDMLKDEQAPLIVAGDFNMTDISEDYGRMTANLLDSFRESGSGFGLTFPAWSPIPAVRLDYIFHSSDLRSLKTEVMPSPGGSDHFPVRAELSFTSPPTTEPTAEATATSAS